MEMRAIQDIGIGEDLTPPLRPLAAVLHDSALNSHCSACFSTLPCQPFSPFVDNAPTDSPTPLYCSLNCSAADSALHSSSGEHHLLSNSPHSLWESSSDLRLSLRLAHIFQNLPQDCIFSPQSPFVGIKNESLCCLERISGLMTNRENLVFKKTQIDEYDYDESLKRIREGAEMMAKARGKDVNLEGFALEEMVLCLVMTNAVEVQEKSGSCLGIAVYDAAFSWINHSCSPNSCYRFSVGPANDERLPLRIAPAASIDVSFSGRNGDGLRHQISDRFGYGPTLVVRSVKSICKGEEVTIAYTDLLQPKEMRQAELLFKHRFICSCKRCGALPTSYTDYALQARPTENPKSSDHEIEKVMQNSVFEDAITDYLSFGDPKLCCQKLEVFLCDGEYSYKSLESKEAKLPQKVKCHPFHHRSLQAYTALASAYKVQACDLLALSCQLEALKMDKTSSAYSLLLAGVVNHLYMSEPAIVTAAANFWINAGESLLNLARRSLKDDAFLYGKPFKIDLSTLLTLKCDDCCLVDSLEANTVRPDRKMQLEEIKSRLCNCIANISSKIWSFLSSESNFLKFIQNPVDLRWLESPTDSEVSDTDSQSQIEICSNEVKMNLILLSIHCLRYGALLLSICYGFSVETNYLRALDVIMKA
ncbi:protein SET DOMAIN GROUP 41 [Salvia hispanica]|uniref:protein SET DOMAIN GROUP 41 n=1 Tax=Salvia hispanica TaxID=49212 RepID=UPI002009AE86|nr:protein SET DOMAIN GROUP 41 [Salvia hispanica]